jgi:CYTH domain-containing protein
MAEIERKWLVETVPANTVRWSAQRLEQGYLAITDQVEVRVRRSDGGDTRLAVKSSPALSRVEEQLPLEDAAFDRLWPLTEGRRVVKVRHTLEDAPGVVFELDVYEGELDGLVTLEVEFADEAAAARFTPPEWADREVTGDKAYANQSLAVHGRP